MIGPCSEISVIVTHLGCESVVYLDNHMQWLCRLYVFVLFCYCLLFVEGMVVEGIVVEGKGNVACVGDMMGLG